MVKKMMRALALVSLGFAVIAANFMSVKLDFRSSSVPANQVAGVQVVGDNAQADDPTGAIVRLVSDFPSA